MNFDLTDEQAQFVEAFGKFLAKECPPQRVRDAEPAGFDEELWAALRGQGVVEMALPSEAGGWGASLLDLALAAELHGQYLAPAPLVDVAVAARLLSDLPGAGPADLLTEVLEGGRRVVIAPNGPVGGVCALVPGGAVSDQVLWSDGHAVMAIAVGADGRRVQPNVGCLALADVPIDGSQILTDDPEAVVRFTRAVDEWMALSAATLVGMGAKALELGCTYAAERQQFGQPIAMFQAISHGLADHAADLDGARLLAYEAASVAGEIAAMAFAFASQVANEVAAWSLHVHGGYGFMLEYDVQLYVRRAKAWGNLLGGPHDLLSLVADRRWGPVPSSQITE